MKRLCKKCNKEKELDNFPISHGYHRHTCKICKQKDWMLRYNSDELFRVKINQANNSNRIKNKSKRNEYEKNRRKNNIGYRIRINLRNRITEILANKKRDKSINLIGCSLDFLIKHLESQFQLGMNWQNYGIRGWHIDHIMPCDSFDLTLESEQRKCFHYSNLQPLWAKDNLSKSNKII